MKLDELQRLVAHLQTIKVVPNPEVYFSTGPGGPSHSVLPPDNFLNLINNEGDFRIQVRAVASPAASHPRPPVQPKVGGPHGHQHDEGRGDAWQPDLQTGTSRL